MQGGEGTDPAEVAIRMAGKVSRLYDAIRPRTPVNPFFSKRSLVEMGIYFAMGAVSIYSLDFPIANFLSVNLSIPFVAAFEISWGFTGGVIYLIRKYWAFTRSR